MRSPAGAWLSGGRGAPRFYFKATGLGTYMLYDPRGRVLIDKRAGLSRLPYPGVVYDWAAEPVPGKGAMAFRSTRTRAWLSGGQHGGGFTVSRASGRRTAFRLEPAAGCKPFPEAQVDAVGTPSKGATATDLYKLGGFAAVTPDQAPALAQKILSMTKFKDRSRFFGVGLGTDTGGFSPLPGPRSDAAAYPLRHPFTSYCGKVTFRREVTGDRTFDLNTDGVAQYGLIADLLADMRQQPGGRKALALLFRSAEGYLETWQRAFSHR